MVVKRFKGQTGSSARTWQGPNLNRKSSLDWQILLLTKIRLSNAPVASELFPYRCGLRIYPHSGAGPFPSVSVEIL